MKTATLLSESSLSLPANSYIYKILHTNQNAALAAISSDDSLRIFDPEKLQLEAGGIFDKTHEGVTCLETFDADPHCVLTAGRDAAGRCWDLRSGMKTFEVNDSRLCWMGCGRSEYVLRGFRKRCIIYISRLFGSKSGCRYRTHTFAGYGDNMVGLALDALASFLELQG